MSVGRFALVLHGRLGSWLMSASELPEEQRKINTSTRPRDVRNRQLSTPAAVQAFAAFTHHSLWQHVVMANRAQGARVRVVIHSWSPEVGATLDRLYQPAASLHEPAHPELDKVASQHLSMRRALALLHGLSGSADDLIMVARLDLLLYTDIPFVSLLASGRRTVKPSAELWPPALGSSPATSDLLYLPHTCVPSRLKLPGKLAVAEQAVLRRTCSGRAARGASIGRRMLPTQLTRYRPGALHSMQLADDFTLFVLDYFFIGTPRVAASFATLSSDGPTGEQIRHRFERGTVARRARVPQWSHLYWAHHVTETLVPAGVRLRFALLHEVDFQLARHWRYAVDCTVAAATTAVEAAEAAGQQAVQPWQQPRSLLHGSSDAVGRVRGGDEAWAAYMNVSRLAKELRGAGDAALAASALAEQCPRPLATGTQVLCPWYSNACAARHADLLQAAESAGRFLSTADLPARQLLGAERCHSTLCESYEGTARRRSTRRRPSPMMIGRDGNLA